MAKANRQRPARVNFFDGQRVTESDLDAEQVHHRSLVSDLTKDFHGSGIVRDRLFESQVLFDTSDPGRYSDAGNEASKFIIDSGAYDGKPIGVDRQPSDSTYGNRLEVQASDLNIGGSVSAKVMILGTTYSSLSPSGDLVCEIVEFSSNQTKLTEFYYLRVIAVLFNNISGGHGRTETSLSKESLNTLGEKGSVIIRESEPLKAFSRTRSVFQIESPNLGMRDFITSSPQNTIEQEIRLGLGTVYNFKQLYFELEGREKVYLRKDGDQTVSFGQKFLSKSNNIQRLDLLLSVEKDDSAIIGSEYDFSGELVVSIHKLSTDIKCITDPNPDNLIDFDPEQSPLIEISCNMDDLKAQGADLTESPRMISFDFSGTLIADPNIEPSLQPDEFYAFLVSRRGDNRTGTIVLEKAYDKITRKIENGQSLSASEQFEKRHSRYIEFDPNNSTFVDDNDSSLWFVVHSNSVEITDGMAYSDDGYPIVLSKTEGYIGNTEISRYLRDVDLKDVSEGGYNYVILSRGDKFEAPGVHPRTGNFVNTRIKDEPMMAVLSQDEIRDFEKDSPPIVLARISDRNVRDAQDIEGKFDTPGLIYQDEVIIVNPDPSMLEMNLIGRIFTPDLDCNCTSRYRIVSAACEVHKVGDLDNDGERTSADIMRLLNVVGNTINAETTERKILGGELDAIDFIKSDLNGDGTVDGDDISLLEDAVAGKVDFNVSESFKILRIKLENISQNDNSPKLFSTEDDTATASSASTASGLNTVSLTVVSDEQALSFRQGDLLFIHEGSADSGSYVISSKIVDESGVKLVIGVTDIYGDEVLFSGSSSLDATISSGSLTNLFADNMRLLSVPFEETSFRISYEGTAHSDEFVEVCDLRRYVETNFIEESSEACLCSDEACISGDKCSPQYKNQKVLADDLFIPRGEIYSEPGIPYHGDIEYASISMPLPPGTIDDCAIDLYTSFIKSDGGSCKTAAGYPAMVFSDGTYVGCEDAGGETDIAKGRVKITQCIASLYVDSFVDGYMVDGYADETDNYTASEIIKEEFLDHTFPNASGFSEWPKYNPPTYSNIDTPLGYNQPAKFELTTINADYRQAYLNHPSSITPDLAGDFVVDFVASRSIWNKEALLYGSVTFHSTLTINNTDGTEVVLKLGWKQLAHQEIKMFFSGVMYDSATSNVISAFEFEKEAQDDVGDEIVFRLRRVDEAVFAMYCDKTLIEGQESVDREFLRIGSLTSFQPGAGDATMAFEISQDDAPNPGELFLCTLYDVVLNSNYASESLSSDTALISRDSSGNVDRLTATFPVLLTRRTNIVSAKLLLTSEVGISSTESFNVIPYDIVNADNLGTMIDYPLEQNHSFVTSFIPGNLSAGESIEVDITSIIIYYLSQPGHLPGFYKALTIEPSEGAEESFLVSGDIKISVDYEDITTGVVFQVGASIDSKTGIVTLNTKNILYDAINESSRTILNFGVHLKKSGFKNSDLSIGIRDLSRIGIGVCADQTEYVEDELCFFIAGSTATGTFVEGPFPCYFHLP